MTDDTQHLIAGTSVTGENSVLWDEPGYRSPPPAFRFDEKWVPEPTTGCWLWIAASTRGGYGHISIRGRFFRSHRLAFARWVGPIPDGAIVDHVCRTTACVNPDHLRIATLVDNNRYRIGNRRQTSSKFKGVSRCARDVVWRAYLGSRSLGSFASESDAARAYDREAEALYGSFALTNRKMGLL